MTDDTICAISTASGGAIGLVRVSGPQALSATKSIFNRKWDTIRPRYAYYGEIKSADQIIDDAVVTFFPHPHSYTGEDLVEISCHGSAYILQRVLELLLQNGCRMAGSGEFTQRAFLNGKMDLTQAEAVADLIASSSAATHRLAMRQLKGAFSRDLQVLRDQLLQITTLLELELDFMEDVEFADRKKLYALTEQTEQHISHLVDSFRTGNAVKQGIPVAIIGAPNVGKSTLLNALLHEDRAIVSNVEGTTRDTIEDVFVLGGYTFRFIDTAGIRHTEDIVEQMGITRSLQAASRADILLMLTEPNVPFPQIEVADHQQVIYIMNKCDLLGTTPEKIAPPKNLPQGAVICTISAREQTGLEALEAAIVQAVPTYPENDVVITNARHYEILTKALQSIRLVKQNLTTLPGDLVAQDLRYCLSCIAEILGTEISSNEVIHNIFRHFCIGK